MATFLTLNVHRALSGWQPNNLDWNIINIIYLGLSVSKIHDLVKVQRSNWLIKDQGIV